ncbi:MAG: hypothetical protein KDK34_23610, partial [Leptospiraceae bacterium]|nr:hypothetical protein [Leptospiraceae bacterium]
MNKNLKYFIFIILSIFLVLLFTSQMGKTEQPRETEMLTYSEFKSMLTPEGQSEIGTIISPLQKEAPEESTPSFLGLGQEPVTLQISNKKITGRFAKPGVEVPANASREEILNYTYPFVVEIIPGTVTDELKDTLEANQLH